MRRLTHPDEFVCPRERIEREGRTDRIQTDWE